MGNRIFGTGRAVIAFLLVGMLLACSGCMFSRPPEADKAQKLKRDAMARYVANTNAIHDAQQKAYKQQAAATAQALFEQGIERIKLKAGADGKVSAVDVAALVTEMSADREKYMADAEKRIEEIKVTIAEADRDIYSALKLDDLLERFNASGVDPAFAQSAIDSILEIARGATGKGGSGGK